MTDQPTEDRLRDIEARLNAGYTADHIWDGDKTYACHAADDDVLYLLDQLQAAQAALKPFALDADELYELNGFFDDVVVPMIPQIQRPDGNVVVFRVLEPGEKMQRGETTIVWSHDVTIGDLRKATKAAHDALAREE